MSRSRKASSLITLDSTRLDGYTGNLMIVRAGRKRWYHRILRRRPRLVTTILYGSVSNGKALVWSRK